MTDYNDWYKIKLLENEAARRGMRLATSKYGRERLTLIPLEDKLSGVNRDTEFETGTVEELLSFLHGWESAIQYFTTLQLVSTKSIATAELEIMCDRTVDKLVTGRTIL